MSNHEIKTIVAELQSMSPRTQLEIVRLCKRVAELTPSYIEQLSDEDYAEFVSLVNQLRSELQAEIDTTNAHLTDATAALQTAIDAINSSIRNITFDTEENKTRITGTLKTTIIETNRIIDEDSQILFGTNQGLVLRQGDHVLNLDDGGLLWLDGVQITPAPEPATLYQHNIMFSDNSNNVNYRLSIINGVAESYTNNQKVPFTTVIRDAICNAIISLNPIPTGFTAVSVPVAGYIYQSGSAFNFPQVCIVSANEINCKIMDWNGSNLSIRNNILGSTYTIEDKCISIGY